MLSSFRDSIMSKAISGLMLASITLSFSGGLLGMHSRNTMADKTDKTVTGLYSKQPNTRKQSKTNQRTVSKGNPKQTTWAQTELAKNIPIKSDIPNKNPEPIKVYSTEKPTVNVVEKTPVNRPKPNSSPNVDLYLLARVIYAESRGEPLQGQVAVGAVLLNRLKDSRFPKNLAQIIFKRGEFCTVRDGQIWKTPSQEAIKAARLAAAGWDPTGGALYFYNPAKTTSRWIWSRPIVNKIGNHIFAI